jgi:C_GCAxxG_C_C family probable redox protein
LRLGGGFGGGAGTKELCGAITGAVMTLGMLTPIDPEDPAAGRKVSAALAREFQKRFRARFGALRCEELLQKKFTAEEAGHAAAELNISGHCTMMIVAAVETTTSTYVKNLKAQDLFDENAQKEAFNKTFETVKKQLTKDSEKIIAEVYGDVETYITNKIEQLVEGLKK